MYLSSIFLVSRRITQLRENFTFLTKRKRLPARSLWRALCRVAKSGFWHGESCGWWKVQGQKDGDAVDELVIAVWVIRQNTKIHSLGLHITNLLSRNRHNCASKRTTSKAYYLLAHFPRSICFYDVQYSFPWSHWYCGWLFCWTVEQDIRTLSRQP